MKKNQPILTLALALTASAAFAQAPAGDPPAPPAGGGPGGQGGPGGPRPKSPLMTALDADGDGTISAEEMKNAPAALKSLLKNGADHLTMEDLRPPRREGEGPGGPGGPQGGGDGQRTKRGGDGAQAGAGQDGQKPAGGGDGQPRRRPQGDGANAGGPGGGPSAGAQGGPGGGPQGGGPGGGGLRPVPPIIAALDANHDGTISAEEIAASPAALKTLDKNGDGKLTEDEIRPMRPQGGGPGGGQRPEGAGAPSTGAKRPAAE